MSQSEVPRDGDDQRRNQGADIGDGFNPVVATGPAKMMEALIFCGSLWNADMCEVGTLEVEECERPVWIDAAYDDEDGQLYT